MVSSYLGGGMAIVAGAALLAPATASASLIDFLSTPPDAGIVGGGDYNEAAGGFRVHWTITLNPGGTSYHYKYEFTDQGQNPLNRTVSHIILQLSENIAEEDLFNFVGVHKGEVEFGTFGPAPGNPGFPGGETIFGVKLGGDGSNTIEFDSVRQPHWADFYAKGANDFVYNTDLGVAVSNPDDFNAPSALDLGNQPIFKILAPNGAIPAPGAWALLGVAGLCGRRRRRRIA